MDPDSNPLSELIQSRQSTRKYLDKPVPREAIERVLDLTHLAPSATNSQPWHFIVVDDPELKVAVAKCLTSPILPSMNTFAKEAPVLIVVVEESANVAAKMDNLLKKQHFSRIDIGIAVGYLTLAARSEGLDTCVMGWLDNKKIRDLLRIPREKTVQLVISLGYSDDPMRPKTRKKMDKIRSYNTY